jgi:3-methyladenine DNA glycosylase AlkC
MDKIESFMTADVASLIFERLEVEKSRIALQAASSVSYFRRLLALSSHQKELRTLHSSCHRHKLPWCSFVLIQVWFQAMWQSL